MRAREELGFNDRWLMIIGIPFVALVINSIIFSSTDIDNSTRFLTCYPISIIFTSVFWIIFRQCIMALRKRKRFQENTFLRLGAEVILIIVIYFLIEPILEFLVKEVLQLQNSWSEPTAAIKIFTGLIFSLFVTAIYEIIYIQSKLERSNLEREQLSRAHIQSQLDGLKSQIQPHFLFNSLNTLAGLIPQDENRAVRYVQKLSRVFRYVLEIRDEALITLEEEVEFLNAYIYLLKERFGNNLQVELDIPTSYHGRMVVPLSLQILFENAIKHNKITREEPLKVRVYISAEGKLTVENNLQLREESPNGTKMGLENIRKRYRFVVDDPVDIVSSIESFMVSLPLIKSPSIP